MPEPGEYRPTFFDRHGADGVSVIRAVAYGLLVFGCVIGAFTFATRQFNIWVLLLALFGGAITGGFGLMLGNATAGVWRGLMVNGSSTPYVEQYSYQQSLVMRGEIDHALESFEAVIADKPAEVSPRMKAAELYARERKNFQRASELFREIQRIPTVMPGEYIHATNRLVDLLIGPLADPGRAMVELRRLIERHPTSPAAAHARDVLTRLKAPSGERRTDTDPFVPE